VSRPWCVGCFLRYGGEDSLRRLRSLGRSPQQRSFAPLSRGSPPRARFAKPPTGTLSAFPLSLTQLKHLVRASRAHSYSIARPPYPLRGSAPSGARHSRAPHGDDPRTNCGQTGAKRRCSYESVQGGEGVLGGAPAARARRFGRASAPQRRACEDAAPQRTPSPTQYRDASLSACFTTARRRLQQSS
jgi:hypothetical protein